MTKQTYPFANELTFKKILQLKILSPLQYFVHPVVICSTAVRSLFPYYIVWMTPALPGKGRTRKKDWAVKWRKNEFPTLVLLKTFALKPFSRTFWKLKTKNPILAESSP